MEQKTINVIGAGLAGVEASYYLARHGFKVNLFEQKPHTKSPAHHSDNFGELVCSNSLKSNRLDNACGLLKEELRLLGSLTMEAAETNKVPSGNALSVDRERFAAYLTEKIKSEPMITIYEEEVKDFKEGYNLICTGPLTSDNLIKALQNKIGEEPLFFYDAAAPIIAYDSLDMNICYRKSRYNQGDDSYINCPFTKEQYEKFYSELINAQVASLHDFDKVFEGCMPIEVMAKRGEKTLRYGPLKPMGLEKDGIRPYAVLQLRQDNASASLYNMVGFQTNLTYGEQRRVFRLIPGLEKAEFYRYGLMHRNTFICAPKVLNSDLSLKCDPDIFIGGQLSGVEGYVESAMSGLIAAFHLERRLKNKPMRDFPLETMCGSLINYLMKTSAKNFAPMNANFGIVYNCPKDKEIASQRAIAALKEFLNE